MDKRTTLEVIAPTVEEALAQGLAQLGLPADAVSVEVLDAGNKGLFGLGGRQVRVRLTVNGPNQDDSKRGPSPAAKPDTSPRPVKKTEARPPEHDKLLDKAEEVVSKILHYLHMQAQVSAHYGESDDEDRRPIHVDIRGEDLGILIGRHSETLNAFQYVVSLMVGREMQQWVKLVLDVEGYRSRREHQIQQMAGRVAEQAVKSGRRTPLEPMPAAERRIVHIALRGHPAVTTESTGEEPYRKVVIIPKDS